MWLGLWDVWCDRTCSASDDGRGRFDWSMEARGPPSARGPIERRVAPARSIATNYKVSLNRQEKSRDRDMEARCVYCDTLPHYVRESNERGPICATTIGEMRTLPPTGNFYRVESFRPGNRLFAAVFSVHVHPATCHPYSHVKRPSQHLLSRASPGVKRCRSCRSTV